MKMNFTFEELNGYAADAEEVLEKKLEELIKQYAADLRVEQVVSVRNEVFFNSYRSFMKMLEDGDFSYDFEQIGRFSYYLHQSLESVWLEYSRRIKIS